MDQDQDQDDGLRTEPSDRRMEQQKPQYTVLDRHQGTLFCCVNIQKRPPGQWKKGFLGLEA